MIHPRVPGGGSSITFYNERDQATEAQVHDLHGNRVGRVLASCDADGRLTEEREISADFGEVSSTLYTYDSQNRLTQKRQHFDTIIGSVERVTIVTYNEHGDKVEESTSSNDLQKPARFATTITTTATETGRNKPRLIHLGFYPRPTAPTANLHITERCAERTRSATLRSKNHKHFDALSS